MKRKAGRPGRIGWYRAILVFFALLAGTLLAALNAGRLELEGSFRGSLPGELRLYWAQAGTKERGGPALIPFEAETPLRFRVASPPVDLPTGLRLVIGTGRRPLCLKAPRYRPLNLLFPFSRLLSNKLGIGSAKTLYLAAAEAGAGYCQVATGRDPELSWRIPAPAGVPAAAAMNAAAILLLLALAHVPALALRRAPQDGGNPVSRGGFAALPLLALFFLYVAFAWVNERFADLLPRADTALYAAIALFAAFLLLREKVALTVRGGLQGAAAASLLFVVSFDLAYHLDDERKPPFSRLKPLPYHWKLARTAEENFRHSSLRYYADFDRMEKLVEPGARFISDASTSYYVAAALPLYMSNSQLHHWQPSMLKPRIMEAVCTSPNAGALQQILLDKRNRDRKAGIEPIRYFIINRDGRNVNVVTECLARKKRKIAGQLEGISARIFSGKYLDLYELDYGTAQRQTSR